MAKREGVWLVESKLRGSRESWRPHQTIGIPLTRAIALEWARDENRVFPSHVNRARRYIPAPTAPKTPRATGRAKKGTK